MDWGALATGNQSSCVFSLNQRLFSLTTNVCDGPETKAAIHAAYLVNVGNRRDNGHSTQSTPTAA